MKKSIVNCLNIALEKYTTQAQREGYQMTLFTRMRHSFTKTSKIKALEEAIERAPTDNAIMNILATHFTHANATFNNHSFNSYFIDALKQCDALSAIDWDCFTPRAVKRFRGQVYRGMSRPPKLIFESGLSEKETSPLYNDYLKVATGSVGVSTSKSFDTALAYTTNYRRTGDDRFIYEIDYRGAGGFDVFETIKAQGLAMTGLFSSPRKSAVDKAEVNIKGGVSRAEIKGAYQVGSDATLTWQANPHFKPAG